MHTKEAWLLHCLSKDDDEWLVYTKDEHTDSSDIQNTMDKSICVVSGGLGCLEEGGCHESRANARLIAASPLLLEACEFVLAFVSSQLEAGLDCKYEKELLTETIKKAKGEP